MADCELTGQSQSSHKPNTNSTLHKSYSHFTDVKKMSLRVAKYVQGFITSNTNKRSAIPLAKKKVHSGKKKGFICAALASKLNKGEVLYRRRNWEDRGF